MGGGGGNVVLIHLESLSHEKSGNVILGNWLFEAVLCSYSSTKVKASGI